MKKNNKIKLILILTIIILLYSIIKNTFSLYEVKSNSKANIEVAFFILKDDYYVKNINVGKLIPRDDPYIYTFSVSNSDGENISETNLEYNLYIRTTTNIPLLYELYMNENYDSEGATSKIISDEVYQDENGTYFRKLLTDTETMNYTTEKTNIYNLIVYFPSQYNLIEYQDIIESIEINIEAKQKI